MYKGKTFLGVIPARGGSKGIPRKNIINVCGKPLIQYTIEEALKSNFLDKVIVSTEDEEIAKISRECGAEVPFLRPKELAEDTTKTIEVLIHAVNEMKKQGYTYDYVVLLQPTQPLRRYWHIDEAIAMIVDRNEESLVSVSEVREHPLLMRKIDENGKVINLFGDNSDLRRQEFPKIYKVNGAIYINKINENFNAKVSPNDNKLAYIMDRKYDIDIDEPIDVEIFKLMLERIIN
ncbi:acylneuraminate cytidylyltransferase [Caldicellulosiruptor obsidiansis OB47]|uniref:Acylneuraminate cytidylyltransferase n=1 Tax=Caldicellulosiruptor obsidiansis (strain ATCC BAA-2073 / JCM 16842 / OB47) TaxID=608506 RepID=D9TJP8_CALOO|nr:acylneuraminate cytidylyltransferase family protein [Caldicellulosiruptor obsidiansis]ADL42230.1 acylneuraminate cytidylyltransferase [Caldicellulosiruptor obsidiansis OB47]